MAVAVWCYCFCWRDRRYWTENRERPRIQVHQACRCTWMRLTAIFARYVLYTVCCISNIVVSRWCSLLHGILINLHDNGIVYTWNGKCFEIIRWFKPRVFLSICVRRRCRFHLKCECTILVIHNMYWIVFICWYVVARERESERKRKRRRDRTKLKCWKSICMHNCKHKTYVRKILHCRWWRNFINFLSKWLQCIDIQSNFWMFFSIEILLNSFLS